MTYMFEIKLPAHVQSGSEEVEKERVKFKGVSYIFLFVLCGRVDGYMLMCVVIDGQDGG
jgi:hypothetical protein